MSKVAKMSKMSRNESRRETRKMALYAVNPFVAESRKSSAVAGPAFSRL